MNNCFETIENIKVIDDTVNDLYFIFAAVPATITYATISNHIDNGFVKQAEAYVAKVICNAASNEAALEILHDYLLLIKPLVFDGYMGVTDGYIKLFSLAMSVFTPTRLRVEMPLSSNQAVKEEFFSRISTLSDASKEKQRLTALLNEAYNPVDITPFRFSHTADVDFSAVKVALCLRKSIQLFGEKYAEFLPVNGTGEPFPILRVCLNGEDVNSISRLVALFPDVRIDGNTLSACTCEEYSFFDKNCIIPIMGNLDVERYLIDLKYRLTYEQAELERSLGITANKSFVAKAPREKVAEEEKKLMFHTEEVARLSALIAKLEAESEVL